MTGQIREPQPFSAIHGTLDRWTASAATALLIGALIPWVWEDQVSWIGSGLKGAAEAGQWDVMFRKLLPFATAAVVLLGLRTRVEPRRTALLVAAPLLATMLGAVDTSGDITPSFVVMLAVGMGAATALPHAARPGGPRLVLGVAGVAAALLLAAPLTGPEPLIAQVFDFETKAHRPPHFVLLQLSVMVWMAPTALAVASFWRRDVARPFVWAVALAFVTSSVLTVAQGLMIQTPLLEVLSRTGVWLFGAGGGLVLLATAVRRILDLMGADPTGGTFD